MKMGFGPTYYSRESFVTVCEHRQDA